MNIGIDVSENDGAVDWAAVANAGYTFAYARATLGHEASREDGIVHEQHTHQG